MSVLDPSNTDPTISEIQTLDGKIFAMLTERERAVFTFYRDQGRKFGVAASINSAADPAELARAKSLQDADEIMRRANSTVSVVVTRALSDASSPQV